MLVPTKYNCWVDAVLKSKGSYEFLCYHSGVSFKSEILLSVLQEGCEDLDRVIDDLKMILL